MQNENKVDRAKYDFESAEKFWSLFGSLVFFKFAQRINLDFVPCFESLIQVVLLIQLDVNVENKHD